MNGATFEIVAIEANTVVHISKEKGGGPCCLGNKVLSCYQPESQDETEACPQPSRHSIDLNNPAEGDSQRFCCVYCG